MTNRERAEALYALMLDLGGVPPEEAISRLQAALEQAPPADLASLAARLLTALDRHEDATDAVMGDAYHPDHQDPVYEAKANLRTALQERGGENHEPVTPPRASETDGAEGRDATLAHIRARIAQVRAEREAESPRVRPSPPPRYDAVFYEGVAWLDGLDQRAPQEDVQKTRVRVTSLPSLPLVGTRCFYKNEALHLEGWGQIAAPRDDIDAEALPVLTPWIGTLTGPRSAGQVSLDQLAPGCGVFSGKERYYVVPAYLLWVEEGP